MSKLTSEQIRALPAEDFGLPKTKQFPMPDKAHVIKAIQLFKYCPDKDKKELAENINKKAKELGVRSKISTSSSFYHYAKQTIFNIQECGVITEFHIGQLSPIVGGQKTIITKEKKSRMDKLKAIWDNTLASISSKNKDTLGLVIQATNEQNAFDVDLVCELDKVVELNYALTHYISFVALEDFTIFSHDEPNMECHYYDTTRECLHSFTFLVGSGSDSVTEMSNLLRSMKNDAVIAKSIALFNYSTAINQSTKNRLNEKVGIMYGERSIANSELNPTLIYRPDFNYRTIDNYPDEYLMDEEDVYDLKSMMRVNREWFDTIFTYSHNFNSGYIALLEFLMQNRIKFHLYTEGSNQIMFASKDGELYVCVPYDTETGKLYRFFCLIKRGNEEYNNTIIDRLSVSDTTVIDLDADKFSVETNELVKRPLIEKTDFMDVTKDIDAKANSLHTITFKLSSTMNSEENCNLCLKELKKNLDDNDLYNFKYNLAFLFVNIIKLNDNDNKDAEGTQRYISGFNTYNDNLLKIDRGFNFIEFFKNECMPLISGIFAKDLTEEDIEAELGMRYIWIRKF